MIFAAVAFLSFAFYLGSQESHQLLKARIVESFLVRFGAFVLVGFGLSLFPILLNFLVAWFTPLPFINAYRFTLKAAQVSGLGALIGTFLFFSH